MHLVVRRGLGVVFLFSSWIDLGWWLASACEMDFHCTSSLRRLESTCGHTVWNEHSKIVWTVGSWPRKDGVLVIERFVSDKAQEINGKERAGDAWRKWRSFQLRPSDVIRTADGTDGLKTSSISNSQTWWRIPNRVSAVLPKKLWMLQVL